MKVNKNSMYMYKNQNRVIQIWKLIFFGQHSWMSDFIQIYHILSRKCHEKHTMDDSQMRVGSTRDESNKCYPQRLCWRKEELEEQFYIMIERIEGFKMNKHIYVSYLCIIFSVLTMRRMWQKRNKFPTFSWNTTTLKKKT